NILLVWTVLFTTNIWIYTEGNEQNNFAEMNSKDVVYEESQSFYSFQPVEDDPVLINSKSNSFINFSYSGGSSNLVATDIYRATSQYGDCSDFHIELTIVYDYTGISLGEFFLRLESNYAEDGSAAIETNERLITQNILFDHGSDPLVRIIGHPNDGYDNYTVASGSISSSGVLVFRISRTNSNVLCEIDCEPEFTLSHYWTTGLTKPLSSIVIGGTIYPINNSIIDVSFRDYYSYNKYGEETTTPTPTPTTTPTTPDNGNATFPTWGWIVIGGVLVSMITVFIVADVVMRKRSGKTS
ncbi:MAG: hypothetical protein ACTSSH_03935, partial [Candidatus Heimdallarchaeota archaeon]